MCRVLNDTVQSAFQSEGKNTFKTSQEYQRSQHQWTYVFKEIPPHNGKRPKIDFILLKIHYIQVQLGDKGASSWTRGNC